MLLRARAGGHPCMAQTQKWRHPEGHRQVWGGNVTQRDDQGPSAASETLVLIQSCQYHTYARAKRAAQNCYARRLGLAAFTITAFPVRGLPAFCEVLLALTSGRRWRADAKPFQGSVRKRARRSGIVRKVNLAGSSLRATSSHASGVATVAPGLARGQNDATAVAPMPFRNQSIRIFPRRSTFFSVDR